MPLMFESSAVNKEGKEEILAFAGEIMQGNVK
jgi:hypothetical protein